MAPSNSSTASPARALTRIRGGHISRIADASSLEVNSGENSSVKAARVCGT